MTPINISIKHLQIPKGRRILAVSDIHGHCSLFQRLLKQADFSDSDILILIGDLIEKGRENLASLRYAMDLSQQSNVTVLMGNVDLMRLKMIEELCEETCEKFFDYLMTIRNRSWSSIFDEMAAEAGITLDSPEKLLSSRHILLDRFHREWDFIRTLPAIAETQNYIFVHGGLPTEDLEEVKTRALFDILKYDNFMASGLTFQKYLVTGHWPVTIYDDHISRLSPLINRSQHIISIDGGCGIYPEGQLNLLIIPEIGCDIDRISHASCDDLPVIEALASQEASASPVNIHYLNGKVRILEDGEEFSHIEHAKTGRRLKVLNKYIYSRDRQWARLRFTDYQLPVAAGDRLSLAEQNPMGCLVKKDGVCGWYQGPWKTLPRPEEEHEQIHDETGIGQKR